MIKQGVEEKPTTSVTIKQGKIAFCVEKEKGGTNRNEIQKIKRLEWNEIKKD